MTSAAEVAPARGDIPPPQLARAPATAAHRQPYQPPIVQPEAVIDDYPRFQGPKSLRAKAASPPVAALQPRPVEPRPQTLAATLSAAPAPRDVFAEARSEIEELFGAQSRDGAGDEDNSAFQVTLPRGVIRQIRILAAQEGTTQRAIVLKALRLAGLAVPDGADIDRRIPAAKRRQHA
jgi:hypothetical protein